MSRAKRLGALGRLQISEAAARRLVAAAPPGSEHRNYEIQVLVLLAEGFGRWRGGGGFGLRDVAEELEIDLLPAAHLLSVLEVRGEVLSVGLRQEGREYWLTPKGCAVLGMRGAA